MLFLSDEEKSAWAEYAREISDSNVTPAHYVGRVRSNLIPAFDYYIGTQLASKGQNRRAAEWLEAGTMCEEDGLFSAAFLMSFLQRHNGIMVKPSVAFEDPRPYLHFAGVPMMKEARSHLVHQFVHSLPAFDHPIRFMDIGCGDGSLTAKILSHLVETGKAEGIDEVLLVDSSPAMIELAKKTVAESIPGITITLENARIQDCSASISRHYDIAMSSLAYHHMPVEDKRLHLARLRPWIDHFLLFEMDANNDTPDLNSPELALSVYQSYGRIMDFVYAYDAPVDVVTDCIDSFLMTEVISLLTRPRGERTEYHMLRTQWHELFESCLAPAFSLRSDSSCYADEYVTLFTMHYGRNQ
ncbi:MAG: class I SAM-dependent methyltransferase [Methanoregula sp.]|nr:class I SAM-dependent methyltransferase [Methanoregula sp.]